MDPTTQQVVLVDKDDSEIGRSEKLEAHRRGVLHRAISVFILNSAGEMLLQKRAVATYHSAGLWSNGCCTHPYPDESPEAAAHRRLREELGFDCPLERAFSFVYRENVGDGLVEHEYDHVFIGTYDGDVTPCRDEVAAVRWETMDSIARDLEANPASYTPWFRICLPGVVDLRR